MGPERSVSDPTVSNLRELHYFTYKRKGYKVHFNDEIRELPQRIKEVVFEPVPVK